MSVRRADFLADSPPRDFRGEGDQPWINEYGELSGMEYEVWVPDDELGTVYIATSHDAVGLVTWWVADDEEEAEQWVMAQLEEAEDEAARRSHDALETAFDEQSRALAFALKRGLQSIAAEDDWNSETIEYLLGPIVETLKGYGIPSIGSSGEDARAFWRGVATIAGTL